MLSIVYVVIYLLLSYVYVKNALLIFQQNHYEIDRYQKNLFSKKNIHFSLTIVYVLIMFILVFFNKTLASILTIAITLLFTAYNINKELNKKYIKPLVVTDRVKRQIVFIAIFAIIYLYILVIIFERFPSLVGILAVCCSYLYIYLVHYCTSPIEEAIKKKFENEARNILENSDELIKVGITGSFGKTSTKNIVKDIIGDSFYTLITPASYNTPMGITRTIRELLKPIHEVFVCEMGADRVDDISYLMNMVKPKYGIVTSIGPQHLNTFGSLENIINEKIKEIELLPEDGVGIINIDNEYIKKYKIKNKCKIIRVGIDNKKADLNAHDIKYSTDGVKFTVTYEGKNHKFESCLLGKYNVTNILCGIALALALNVKMSDIKKSVKAVKPIEHRLELKKINGFTFIDNAFNSNPVGSKMSLDVLSLMPGKKVIVTPGLIDLGEAEDTFNYEFGSYMINKTDYVILVGQGHTKPIYEALEKSGFKMKNVIVVNSVLEAFNYVYKNFDETYTVLLENDLPDVFSY